MDEKQRRALLMQLEGCPFCGSYELYLGGDGCGGTIVSCQECNVTQRNMYTPEQAVREWNRRK